MTDWEAVPLVRIDIHLFWHEHLDQANGPSPRAVVFKSGQPILPLKLFRLTGVYRERVATEQESIPLRLPLQFAEVPTVLVDPQDPPNGGDLMKKNTNEKTRKPVSERESRTVPWKLSKEDKRFLRSLNVSPD